jgi:hypothetical protein
MEHQHQTIHTSSTSTSRDLSKRPKSKNGRVRDTQIPLWAIPRNTNHLSVPWLDFAGSKFDYPDAIEPQICPLGHSDIIRAGTSTYVRGVSVIRAEGGGEVGISRWLCSGTAVGWKEILPIWSAVRRNYVVAGEQGGFRIQVTPVLAPVRA